MDTRMYVMTHKEYTKPEDDMFLSLHVGKALGGSFGYTGDDTGENISVKNKNYCELTGIYWIWKNVSCDIVGICHYRRYFVKDGKFLGKEDIEGILHKYDIIVPNSSSTEFGSLWEHYENTHYLKDMELCREVLLEKYPQYTDAFDLCMNGNLFTLGNMMITTKKIFDEYCTWLFDILFEVEKRIDISGYDAFQARVMGYLSERLLRVWLLNNSYRVREEKVMMLDPSDKEKEKQTIALKKQYIELTIKDLITLYEKGQQFDLVDISPLSVDFGGKTPVWIFVPEGEESAAEEIRVCIRSIKANIPRDIATVKIITIENILEYITLPDWVLDSFNSGRISLLQLTDILMAGVLYCYGGVWISSLYFAVQPLPRKWFEAPSFCFIPYEKDILCRRWNKELVVSEGGNVLFRFLLNALYMYWYKQKTAIDEKLADYILDIACDRIGEIDKIAENGQNEVPRVYRLEKFMNSRYDKEKYEKMIKETGFFRLSAEISGERENIVGKMTYYGKLVREM